MNKIKAQKTGTKRNKKEVERESNIVRTDIQLTCWSNAALTMATIDSSIDVGTAMEKLNTSIERVLNGKTTEIEAMLTTQAKMLEYVFYDSIKRLYGAEIEYAEIYGNMALRAQNQSRKTLQALAELKNPRRTMFIRQQNNAVNQQVNNTHNPELNNFENPKKVANELLKEAKHITQKIDETVEVIEIQPNAKIAIHQESKND